MIKAIINKLKRPPDFIIGGDRPYLLRWWIIPRNRFFCIYLHKFVRDDDDRALHDHPWISCSIILSGGYIEIVPVTKAGENNVTIGFVRNPGHIILRRSTQAHRIRLFRKSQAWNRTLTDQVIPAWTIFIRGPVIREWGFWCEGVRWVHWERFTSPADKGAIGKGCGE